VKSCASLIAEHFRLYNEEFGRITRRAAAHFLNEAWHTAQLDAVERIELYENRVSRCVALLGEKLQGDRSDAAVWIEIKRAYEMLVARRPDGDFYNTFFNSVTRDCLVRSASIAKSSSAKPASAEPAAPCPSASTG